MDKKNTLLLTVIAVATLLVAVVGATFAYFTAQTGEGQSAPIKVTTATNDTLEYGSFDPINISATQQNFGQGEGNRIGTTSGQVTLKANTETATEYCYTASIDVTENTFGYTTEAHTPELIFTATKNSTNIFTNYDITTIKVGNASAENGLRIPTTAGGTNYIHVISANAGQTVNDAWSATVQFVNLDSDQEANTGKSFKASLNFATVSCPESD
ncbi:MAG: hypothetical protein K2M17_06130 [Bacilli bacterium]|nr:hypothetical protein [Bacilli bacterium]